MSRLRQWISTHPVAAFFVLTDRMYRPQKRDRESP